MSALSEVDLRDFQKIDINLLEKTLEDADYEVDWRMPFEIRDYCETLRRIQKKLIQQTPALFKPKA